jgi:hypothetical protein
VDPAIIGKMGGPRAAAKVKTFTDMLGTRLELALAYEDDAVGCAFGPNGIQAAKNAAAGKGGGGNALSRVVAGKGGFGMAIDLAAVMSAVTPLFEAAGKANTLPPTKFESGTTVVAGVTGSGNSLSFYTEVALDKILKVAGQSEKDDAVVSPIPGSPPPTSKDALKK